MILGRAEKVTYFVIARTTIKKKLIRGDTIKFTIDKLKWNI